MPRDFHETKGMKMYQAELSTPDNFEIVNKWYAAELRKLGPEWQGPESARDVAEWTNGNVEWDKYLKAHPVDPTKMAAGVVITEGGSRTLVMLHRADPQQKK